MTSIWIITETSDVIGKECMTPLDVATKIHILQFLVLKKSSLTLCVIHNSKNEIICFKLLSSHKTKGKIYKFRKVLVKYSSEFVSIIKPVNGIQIGLRHVLCTIVLRHADWPFPGASGYLEEYSRIFGEVIIWGRSLSDIEVTLEMPTY